MNEVAKVGVKSVRITRAEGRAAECFTRTYATLAEADRELKRWALTAPGSENRHPAGYDKCDFKITWTDGEEYEGRLDLSYAHAAHGGSLIAAHVREFAECYAGLKRPAHVQPADYERLIDVTERCNPGMKARLKKLLESYEL